MKHSESAYHPMDTVPSGLPPQPRACSSGGLRPPVVVSVLLTCLLILIPKTQAQEADADAPRPAYGVFGHFNLNSHTADFRALPGTPSCCPQYEDGSGTGFSLGGIYEFPVRDPFRLALRAAWFMQDATLETTEPVLVSGASGPIPGTIQHSIDASISSIGLEPLAGYRIIADLSAWLGLHAGYIAQKSFTQKEQLIEPALTGTFENGLRTRNELSGDIPDAGTLALSFLVGLSYQLPLNGAGTFFLVPEVFYAYGLTEYVDNLTWNGRSVRAGLSLRYSPFPSPEPPPPAAPPPAVAPPPAAAPLLVAVVEARGVTEAGVEEDAVRVTVEEISERKQRPLLNYIFFEENSAELPDRYRRMQPAETSTFSIHDLHHDPTLQMYYHVLNIVGKRMQEHPDGSIRLVGCNANTGLEEGNTALSRSRAETVRNYLVSVWDIDPARISVEGRDLPEAASNVNDPDGIAENRRVELYTDHWAILEPVRTDDIFRTATPPKLRFYFRTNAERGIRDWKLDVSQRTRELVTFSDDGTPPRSIDWEIAGDQRIAPRDPSAISYVLHVHDNTGQAFTTDTRSIPVELVTIEKKRRLQVVDDMEIKQYSLILFDFGQSTLNAYNRKVAEDIRGDITLNSRVTVTGYTDRVGDAAVNDRLSRERAHSAAEYLQLQNANISGMGERVEIHDNDVPEGRFYSRTVNIRVETPVRH